MFFNFGSTIIAEENRNNSIIKAVISPNIAYHNFISIYSTIGANFRARSLLLVPYPFWRCLKKRNFHIWNFHHVPSITQIVIRFEIPQHDHIQGRTLTSARNFLAMFGLKKVKVAWSVVLISQFYAHMSKKQSLSSWSSNGINFSRLKFDKFPIYNITFRLRWYLRN